MNILIFAVTALLLVPVAVLCAECLAALLPRRRRSRGNAHRQNVAVLIPAHNEEQVLGATLKSLMPQVAAGDRVVVVADNCDDGTAQIARRLGAEVIERQDHDRRGKGYALDFGMRHLEQNAPGIVVMMDADCHVHDGTIDALAAQVAFTGKPAQAVYLLERPSRPGPKDLVSALAFMVKNLVRPSGLGRMGLPCLLTGTGMAFPWSVIRQAKLASGNIVEDMQLGLDLALDGHAPLFCEHARVTGKLPEQRRAAVTQRTRWEHGHLQTLFTQVPRLLKGAVRRRSLCALALALELAVPPLSLLVMLFIAAIGAAVLAARYGATWIAPYMLLGGAVLALLSILAAWIKFGRRQLPLMSLLAAPFYVLWKIPLYLAFIFKPQKEWIRTERAGANDIDDSDDKGPGSGQNDAFPALQQPGTIDLCGVNVHAISERQCVAQILRRSTGGHGGVVVTPNLDHLRRCRKDADFAQLVAQADLVVADGMPLVWASRLQGTPLPGRVAGSDLISSLSAAAAKTGKSIFLLGGEPGTAQAAADVLRSRHPTIRIAGTYCPPVGFEKQADKMRELKAAIVRAEPDIVFVALGSPKQERLIDRLRDRLPGAWWLGVGISFSFLCGEVTRAPKWMRKSGLEWVHRLWQEPGRLFKRYLLQGVPFAARLLTGALCRGVSRRLGFGRTHPRLTMRIDSGLGSMDVQINGTDLAQTAPRPPRRRPVDDDLDMRNPPETIYRSFLSGFQSELQGTTAQAAPAAPIRTPLSIAPAPSRILGHIKALVLLGGSVRPTRLTTAIERSLLDLPLEDGQSILQHWQNEAANLRRMVGLESLAVRVMVDHASIKPVELDEAGGVTMTVERDLSPYRGTGGLLRDLSAEYQDDDVLVVANAAQALLQPLSELVRALADLEGEVGLIAHADGTPSGLMLVRCRALRKLSQTGYVDMKEQALPLIAKEFKINHIYQLSATGLPIRTLDEYIRALQRRNRLRLGEPQSTDPFAEGRQPSFAIVEEGADIDPSAQLHDSVVLKGAVVEIGAMVVRSIVCPGGMLAAGETVVDSLVLNAEVAAR